MEHRSSKGCNYGHPPYEWSVYGFLEGRQGEGGREGGREREREGERERES